ncbi:MAG TPA: polysaccharide biosynthesis/export family protein [Pirellulales bacterium]|nr:polysaccharide biosynthesis/export family protein [Pirellulales bacterium]
MHEAQRTKLGAIMVLSALVCLPGAGCHSTKPGGHDWAPPPSHFDPKVPPPPSNVPRELSKTTLPDYVIEPPDILLIDAIKVVPRPPYRVETLDVLSVQVQGTLPDHPIEGTYEVQPGGYLDLGPPYGTIKIVGLQLDEAIAAVRVHLKQFLQEPEVSMGLVQSAGRQQIAGEHLVGPDGKVTLGSYGKVHVTGLTQQEAKRAIEAHLALYLEHPEVAVDVFAYNSKVYYVITQGAGLGDGVIRLPITGNETVLDAVSQVNGLDSVSSNRIWIARPAPYGTACHQILPVDWYAVTSRGDTSTNYQLMPGDRVFVAHDRLVAIDTALSKFTAPFDRMFGATLLGTNTVKSIKFFNRFIGIGGGF